MDDIFILKENLSTLDLQDAIDERLNALHALLRCVLSNYASELQLTDETIHVVISYLCDMLDEIELLRRRQAKLMLGNF